MKRFCFTIDDNIRFMKEIMAEDMPSIFAHPYMAMLRRLHEKFDLKIQLNLFYRMEGFDLSQMSDGYSDEWESVADWLKLSFHSDRENVCPYENSLYEEVFSDCRAVNQQILRFAGRKSLAKTTTVHYCQTTEEGLRALSDNDVQGLLGLFGNVETPRTSYSLCEDKASAIRGGQVVVSERIAFASIDMIINSVKLEDILPKLADLFSRESIRVMIHEQYFYEDYPRYQPDFEEKLVLVFSMLREQGYQSCFFEEIIENK